MKDYAEKTMWIEPEADFEDLYQDGQYEDIVRLSDENADLMISLCRRSETEKLKQSLNYGMVVLSYFERSLEKREEASAVFWAGKLKGCLETLDKLQFAGDQDRLAAERAKLLGTKHLNEVIFALETHGTMSQSELGQALGLMPSTLSEILKKIRKTRLVCSSPYGKYKVYSLTGEGARYGALLRQRRQPEKEPAIEMESAIDALQLYLHDSDTREACLKMLKDKLSETSDIIVSKGDQISLVDHKREIKAKMCVNQVLQEFVNPEAEIKPIFVGNISDYHVNNEEDALQTRKVRSL